MSLARLLGAIGELKKFLNFQTKKKEEEEIWSPLKIKEKWFLLFQPDRAFIGLRLPKLCLLERSAGGRFKSI